ncbi:16S rRNA (adenine(1518)-N(6)/adenine(1519)-N(6))-dimethyltransferase RsmA [Lactobacillus jensenii]|uniref:16S rRNA (adenine(1518)-N(6)/adenine(1519)-N(6))- dimethyltransferase RsmA n=1 Tax=Lactobacillus jensenii TaxID=109790 RepID=UPI0022AC17F6|nr:16S rRNA (adenine(1518)-N(6)/adenine(1519)-N(6))-dimethyltransferase RsmA [Lactobacillus jensenii]MCZ3726184.1 16S rRNA (adenine(1518)-N(6)/adenine(1519)-N(6))-dimethyltransferase RsmA [Lactobacillus jensenii]MCZ3730729.1 16S rRNA (adenine(1518)-N(6)/adenine(1519)-N(6))-dimethyltransferase RsmA [Lactobacillus jensenii]MCZ3733779.1 16S rRNA (adenine(1518)-N(6)/adenine(1519)-N(6))-dimethyltransferase RsmA [Lactobacillus jensenii]MCZ3735305.1 16S rRNA (adenine(1518)-N(6)/adenine(1519)-N(6))-dim
MANNLPICDPIRTQAIMNRYLGFAKKNLGQNFLISLNKINDILDAAEIDGDDQVLEIGPGIGSLTEQMLLRGAKVLAYEIDQDLPEILHNELPQKIGDKYLDDVFKLVMKDILKADFKADIGNFFDLNKPVKVVANLPYYITTPIIFALAKSDLAFESLTLMMQKEVAERLCASSGNKEYGPLTIFVQTQMSVKMAVMVDHTNFNPQPKVDSAVVVLKPLVQKVDVGDTDNFDHVVKMCFSQRRKTLNNNLKSLVKDSEERKKLLQMLDLPEKVRPEELSIDQFIGLAKALKAE